MELEASCYGNFHHLAMVATVSANGGYGFGEWWLRFRRMVATVSAMVATRFRAKLATEFQNLAFSDSVTGLLTAKFYYNQKTSSFGWGAELIDLAIRSGFELRKLARNRS